MAKLTEWNPPEVHIPNGDLYIESIHDDYDGLNVFLSFFRKNTLKLGKKTPFCFKQNSEALIISATQLINKYTNRPAKDFENFFLVF